MVPGRYLNSQRPLIQVELKGVRSSLVGNLTRATRPDCRRSPCRPLRCSHPKDLFRVFAGPGGGSWQHCCGASRDMTRGPCLSPAPVRRQRRPARLSWSGLFRSHLLCRDRSHRRLLPHVLFYRLPGTAILGAGPAVSRSVSRWRTLDPSPVRRRPPASRQVLLEYSISPIDRYAEMSAVGALMYILFAMSTNTNLSTVHCRLGAYRLHPAVGAAHHQGPRKPARAGAHRFAVTQPKPGRGGPCRCRAAW
jgi:hypothetical protein